MSMLRRGDEGDDVRRAQEALRRLGATIRDPDGRFGPWTEAAVYVLQHGEGLVADGVIGPQTAARLQDPAAAQALGGPATLALVEGVPYFSQRENVHRPYSTCNVTSLAMALALRGVQPADPGKRLEDELYELAVSPEGMAYYEQAAPDTMQKGFPPYESFDVLCWLSLRHGVPATFSAHRSVADFQGQIEQGRPVMISGAFTHSGHIVLLVGMTAAGDFVCHDPYGDWNQHYQSHDGEARIYERDKVLGVVKVAGGQEKWGVFFDGG